MAAITPAMMRLAFALGMLLVSSEAARAQWVEGTTNYQLDPGPWVDGYIPNPPPEESYRANADVMETAVPISQLGAFLGWVWNVQSGGVWDYKKDRQSLEDFTRLEAAGNFNFGVTAAAQGIPLELAQMLAGIENAYGIFMRNFSFDRLYGGQFRFGPNGLTMELPVWAWTSPFYYGPDAYFDDPSDAVSIRAGYEWYRRTDEDDPPSPIESLQEFGGEPIWSNGFNGGALWDPFGWDPWGFEDLEPPQEGGGDDELNPFDLPPRPIEELPLPDTEEEDDEHDGQPVEVPPLN